MKKMAEDMHIVPAVNDPRGQKEGRTPGLEQKNKTYAGLGPRLSISNIAWAHEESDVILPILSKSGIAGVEVAPGQISPSYTAGVNQPGVFSLYKKRLMDHGIKPSAMQSIIAGAGTFSIWGDEESIVRTLDVISRAGAAAQALGVSAMVLGAPGLRKKRNENDGGDLGGFVRFANRAGRRLLRYTDPNVSIAFEACSSIYGCEFARTHDGLRHVIDAVGHERFGGNFDLATALLEDGDVRESVMKHAPKALHFHISEPNLAEVGTCGQEHHKAAAEALLHLVRHGERVPTWISIEMARGVGPEYHIEKSIERSIGFVQNIYGEVLSI